MARSATSRSFRAAILANAPTERIAPPRAVRQINTYLERANKELQAAGITKAHHLTSDWQPGEEQLIILTEGGRKIAHVWFDGATPYAVAQGNNKESSAYEATSAAQARDIIFENYAITMKRKEPNVFTRCTKYWTNELD